MFKAIYVCVCMYVIPTLIYLSNFLYIFKVSSKEIKLLLFDSSFMQLGAIDCPNKRTLELYSVI